jgi:hypothetical protein
MNSRTGRLNKQPMPEFISSYTRILFSLLGPEMPKLLEGTQRYSTTTGKATSVLSSRQIQEAYSHPSAVIQQTLKVIALTQGALNAANAKLDTIAKQRQHIEAALVTLHARDDVAKKAGDEEQPKASIDGTLKDLHEQLIMLRKSETEIESLKVKLSQELTNIDKKLLPMYSEEWLKHREEYFDKLTKQLDACGIVLNAAEKAELRKGSATISGIQEKLEALKKLGIELPDKASDFEIIAYDAIVAAQSRTLQKIDNKTVKGIAKRLDAIDDEDKASKKLKADHAGQYEKIVSAVKQLEEQVAKIPVLSSDKLELLENIEKQAQKIPAKTEGARPASAG